ncbi:unnamed protein product [Penicillium glandicola]
MVASDSSVSSNWDFTPVHDLLRSPIDGCTAKPKRHDESTIPSLEQQAKDDPRYTPNGRLMDPIPQRSNPKLGDFGSLWELFDGSPAPASVTPTLGTTETTKSEPENVQPSLEEQLSSSAARPAKRVSFSGLFGSETSIPPSSNTSRIINEPKPRILKDTVTKYTSHYSSRSSSHPNTHATTNHADFEGQSFTILKRTSGHEPSETSADVTFGIPRTLPVEITRAGVGDPSDTPTKPKPRPHGKDFRKNTRNTPITSEESAGLDSDTNFVFDRPVSNRPTGISFVPQVGTPKNHPLDTPPSSFEDNDWTPNANNIRGLASGGTRVRSTLQISAAVRKINLMTRLLVQFPSYAKLMSQMGQTSQRRSSESIDSLPIHIFVDMSNIMVGFHDAVKTSRNIPVSARIRRVHMSFANLALIMERGRQTAKRVLVGSDRLPAIDEAKRLGYEANILERVHKVKTVTPRRSNQSRKNNGYSSQGVSSGPETVAASGERWVEQGVDEILHLKILESLLDTKDPATIVLATGDAAVAEFSGGFMKMVERALRHGWSVELVSFLQGTSHAYRKKEFRARWGDRFKLIELDCYVEELFE